MYKNPSEFLREHRLQEGEIADIPAKYQFSGTIGASDQRDSRS